MLGHEHTRMVTRLKSWRQLCQAKVVFLTTVSLIKLEAHRSRIKRCTSSRARGQLNASTQVRKTNNIWRIRNSKKTFSPRLKARAIAHISIEVRWALASPIATPSPFPTASRQTDPRIWASTARDRAWRLRSQTKVVLIRVPVGWSARPVAHTLESQVAWTKRTALHKR